ncbi:MAG: hypothetical protein QOF14_1961, partial [Hyphomicrobiales bacterium]|nr:hypothetical protein [Hyphomicrobiales bacterium]
MLDWQATWQAFAQYLPANPFGTFISAAFGTIGGAWVASRVQTKRAVVAELNSVSSALALCFTICNKAMSLKRQHVLPVRERYEQARRDFDKARIANANRGGGPPLVYTLHADLETLTFPKMPTELLERQLFEKIAIRGRALAAAVDLVGVIDGLEQAIEQRNDLINEFRAAAPIPPDI